MNVRAFRHRPIAEFLQRRTASGLGWGALATSLPGLALAGPTGENVVAGAAAIHRPNATHTQIDQSTQNAVVNWSTFSIDNNEYVIFNQPGATASILNRVVGSQQSRILGHMQANGRVFLVNPQGIYFAPGSSVDVGALTASVLDITNNDFMSGNYVFTRPEGAPDGATVENAGEIKVGDGGYVVLAGDYVNNTGVISARLGTVVLASGSRMTLDLSEDGLVSFAVDEATVASLAGVDNSGEIAADGGRVIMTAKVANGLVATAVNNDGLLQAHRIVEDGGEIYLSASGGDIVNAGAIDVAGASGQSGGEVGITGDEDITLTAGSQINANGDGAGNGGIVNVIADGTLAFREDAEITALAGDSGERGGSVHLSGHDGIQVKGTLTLRDGEVVIDPADLVLDSGNVNNPSSIGTGYVEGVLDGNNNITLWATNSISKTAGATSIVATGTGNLRFAIGSSDNGRMSTGNINLAGLTIDIVGDFNASAGTQNGDVNLGTVAANNVNIHAGNATGNIALNTGGVTAASMELIMMAGDSITVGTATTPGNVSLTGNGSGANAYLWAGGDVTVYGDLNVQDTLRADLEVDGMNIAIRNATVTANNSDAWLYLDATSDATANNLTANGFYYASIEVSAGGKISVNNVTANGDESAYVDMEADGGDLTANNIRANGGYWASIDLSASDGKIAINDATAAASMYSAYIEMDVDNGDIMARNVTATAGQYAGIYLDADNDIAVNDVTAWIPAGLFGGTYGNSTYVDIEADGNITANNVISRNEGALAGSGSYASRWASVYMDAGGNLQVNDVASIIVSGCSLCSFYFTNAQTYLYAGNNIVANDVAARNEAEVLGGGFDAYGGAHVDLWAGNNIDVNSLDVLDKTGGESFYLDGGEGAEAHLWAGNNVAIRNGADIVAQSYAALLVGAVNNVSVQGDVKISEAGSGTALADYHFGGDGQFGPHDVMAGPGGTGLAYFSSHEGDAPNSETFNAPFTVTGGNGSFINVTAENSIRTAANGLLAADKVYLNVLNTGTTTIDAKTKSPWVVIQNLGMTPNVVIDNRAFINPSTFDFGPSGALLKSANFLATGPLLLQGPFTADRLAVDVTNGSVTFAHPVNITGANAFAPNASDLATFDVMTANGLMPPLHGPNVQISALTGINMNEPFNVGGPTPFTKMFTNGPFNVSGLATGADNILAVFSPIDPTRPFFFENEPFTPPLGASALFNFPTLQGLPDTTGATVVVGEIGPTGPVLSGPLTIGSNGPIDIGDRNMFIISRGTPTGDDPLANIFQIIGLAPVAEVFDPPVVGNDFGDEEEGEEEEEDELALIDEGAEGGDETEITEEEAVPKEMECS